MVHVLTNRIIFKQLSKIKDWCTLKNLEFQIIIVNNNSTDKTEEVAQRLVDKNILFVNEKKKEKDLQ